jgi:chromosome segregation ATPase
VYKNITMSSKDLLTEYKLTIAELTKEKKDAVELVAIKDSKIKKILIQLEQANSDVQALGSKIAELQEKLSKKETIKRTINKKIDEILEKKDEETVDKDD